MNYYILIPLFIMIGLLVLYLIYRELEKDYIKEHNYLGASHGLNNNKKVKMK